MREHNEAVNRLDCCSARDADHGRLRARHRREVAQHDGSVLRLRKLARDYDPHDRIAAMAYICSSARRWARSSPACCTSIPKRKTCTSGWARSHSR